MGQIIKMQKWHNGGGVTIRVRGEYDPDYKPDNIISLDFVDVDNLLALLNEYKAHPSPYCLTETCPVHGKPEQDDSAERIDFLASVIVTAFESANVSYWAHVRGYQWKEGDGRNLADASAEIHCDEWENDEWRPVNLETIRAGLARIGEEGFDMRPDLRSIILSASHENDASYIDAEGADDIIQAGLFGHLVYG